MQSTETLGNDWKMSGRILQSDINHGQARKSDLCPLALAIKRELAKWFPERLGKNLFVGVSINAVYLLDVAAAEAFDMGKSEHVLATAESSRSASLWSLNPILSTPTPLSSMMGAFGR